MGSGPEWRGVQEPAGGRAGAKLAGPHQIPRWRRIFSTTSCLIINVFRAWVSGTGGRGGDEVAGLPDQVAPPTSEESDWRRGGCGRCGGNGGVKGNGLAVRRSRGSKTRQLEEVPMAQPNRRNAVQRRFSLAGFREWRPSVPVSRIDLVASGRAFREDDRCGKAW